MKVKDWFRNKLDSLKDDFEFRLESLILDITESISKKMIERKINRSELAELLNVSPPAVTKILNGNSNFTLKSLLSLSDALNLDLKIELRERETQASEQYITTEQHIIAKTGYVSLDELITKTEKKDKPATQVSSGWDHPKKSAVWDWDKAA